MSENVDVKDHQAQEVDPDAQVKKDEPEEVPPVTLEWMKKITNKYKTQVRMQAEPVDELKEIVGLMKRVLESKDATFGDDFYKSEFFYKDVIDGLCTPLSTSVKTKFTKPEFADLIRQLPHLLAEILAKNLDNAELLDSIKSFFDVKSKLFQNHELSEENAILSLTTDHLTDDEKSWRTITEIGTKLDAVKIDPENKIKCWSQATITEKIGQDKIKISFIQDSYHCDRILSILSPELAQFNTRTEGEAEFREGLKLNDRIDCFDSTYVWYACTVLETEDREFQKAQIKMAKVAFRVTHPDGDQKDKDGTTYFGWDDNYDEWIPIYSARIAKYQTHTGDDLRHQSQNYQNSNPMATASADARSGNVDDQYDHKASNIDGQRIYAVQRKQCRSDLLIEFLNKFGQIGGFDSILKIIKDDKDDNHDALNLLCYYCLFFEKAAPVFHREFVDEVFPQLEKEVIALILRAKPAMLRLTKKPKFDEILDSLYKHILPRLEQPHRGNETIQVRDAVQLGCERNVVSCSIGLLFLKQAFLERRVDGMKYLKEVSNSCLTAMEFKPTADNQASSLELKIKMVEEISQKIRKDQFVLNDIFSKDRSHYQIVQRSEEILSFLMAKEEFQDKEREIVWASSYISDQDHQEALYKALAGAASHMKHQDRVYFLEKMKQVPAAELSARQVQLVTEICSTIKDTTQESEEVAKYGLELMWQMSIDAKADSGIVQVNRATLGLSEILQGGSMLLKLEYLDKLAKTLKTNQMGYLVLKVVGPLLKKSFKDPTGHPEIENLGDLIEYMEKKHNFLQITIENLQDYMSRMTAAFALDDWKGDLQAKVYVDRFMHGDQVAERLEFLKYYASCTYKVNMNSDHLKILWDELIRKSPVDSDRKQHYLWLRGLCDQMSTANSNNSKSKEASKIVEVDEMVKFYREAMDVANEESDEFKSLSLEGWHCVQSFFVLINSLKGNLIKITSDHGQYKGAKSSESSSGQVTTPKAKKAAYTSIGSNTGPAFQNFSFTDGKTATSISSDVLIGPLPKPAMVDGSTQGAYMTMDQNPNRKDKAEDPDDLEILALVPPNKMDGYNMLWRVATETCGKLAGDSAAKLLVRIHHNVSDELLPQTAEFDDQFIDKCFQIINQQLPIMAQRSEEDGLDQKEALKKLPALATPVQISQRLLLPERKIMKSIFILKQLIRSSEKKGTHDIRPHGSLRKGITLDRIQVSNNITKGDSFMNRHEISIDGNATVWELKKLIGQTVIKQDSSKASTTDSKNLKPEFPCHPALVRLFRMSNSEDLKDPMNGNTLTELKFKPNETLSAYRRIGDNTVKAAILQDNPETNLPELTAKAQIVSKEIFERFAVENEDKQSYITKATSSDFTKAALGTTTSTSGKFVTKFFEDWVWEGEKGIPFEKFQKFFVETCQAGQDDALRVALRNLGYGPNLKRLPRDGDPENYLQVRKSIEEMPRFKISKNEKYFDTMLSLLDQIKEVAKPVSESFQILATNPILYNKVVSLEKANGSWEGIFDSSNLHKMLYSLEIVEAILLRDQNEISTASWVKKFVQLDGLEEFQNQLEKALSSEGCLQQTDKKQLVVQLLKLLKILVTSSQADSLPKITEVAESKESDETKTTEDDPYKTPQKQIKSTEASTGPISDFMITEQSLFGEADEEDTAPTVSKPELVNKSAAVSKQDDDETLKHLKDVFKADDLRQLVVSKINISVLQDQAAKVVNMLLGAAGELSYEDRPVAESAMGLWSTLVSVPKGNEESASIDPDFVIAGILKCKDVSVRETFMSTLRQVSRTQRSLQEPLMEILLLQMKTANEYGKQTRQYFGLATDIIPIYCNAMKNDDIKIEADEQGILLRILKIAIETLKCHESSEKRGLIGNDGTLQGVLELIQAIIKEARPIDGFKAKLAEMAHSSGLIPEIFDKCLFFADENVQEQNDQAEDGKYVQIASKCLIKESRKPAFGVVQEYLSCLEPHEMVEFLRTYIQPLLAEAERPKKWRHSPSAKGRVHKHCGIINLGCVCYMISMLQQLFMVPQFRYQFLKAVDNTAPDMKEYKGDMIDDNLLRQMQKLFGFLEMSDRHAHSPKEICFAFKDFSGQPTAIGEQKDSHEFLGLLFDRLEQSLKPTSQRDLINNVFAHNACSQLICQSCGATRNKVEVNHTLTLPVVRTQGVFEGLQGLVKGEVIDDFHCAKCNTKRQFVKRQLIAETPNVLLVQLQRLVFNMDTFQNDKVNTRFEFPNVLDLKPYSFKEQMKDHVFDETPVTEEGLWKPEDMKKLMDIPEKDYLYRLVGVNIHSGTADHGHYYSLINTVRGSSEIGEDDDQSKWEKVELDAWKTFDDSKVSHFSFLNDLKKEAFGGDYLQTNGSTGDSMTDDALAQFLSSGGNSYGKSAYVLVYERRSKKNLVEYQKNEQGEEEVKEISYSKVEKFVPEHISEEVKKDNKRFQVDSCLFNEHFFNLMKHIFKIIGGDMVMTSHRYQHQYQPNFQNLKQDSLDIGGKLLFDLLAYYDLNVQIGDTVSNLGGILTFADSQHLIRAGASSVVVGLVKKYYFEDASQHFFNIMTSCTDASSRTHIGSFTQKVLCRLFRLYDDFTPEERETIDSVKEIYATIDQLLNSCLEQLKNKEFQRNAVRLEAFFKMLLGVATSSVSASQYFLDRSDAISDLIDFILGNRSPRAAQETEKRVVMGGAIPPSFAHLYSLIGHLIRFTYTSKMDLAVRLDTHNDDKLGQNDQIKTYFLTEEAYIMLTKTDFLSRVVNDAKFEDLDTFSKAMAHLCYQDLKFSRKIIKVLIQSVSYSSNDEVKRQLVHIESITTLKDEYQWERLEYLFGRGFIQHTLVVGNDLPQYGYQVVKKNNFEESYQILSGLNPSICDESLLSLLWKYKSRLESFTLACLDCLGKIINKDEVIENYFNSLPSPDYRQANYNSWVQPYLNKQLLEAVKYQGSTGTKEKCELIGGCIKFFENHKDVVRPFFIYEALEEREILEQQVEQVTIKVTEIKCSWTKELPPEPSTDSEKPEGDSKDNSKREKLDDEPQGEEVKEQSETENKSEQKQEELQSEWLLYRITATNNSDLTMRLKVSFKQKDASQNVDLIYPWAPVKDYIKTGITSHLMTLQRRSTTPSEGEFNKLEMIAEVKSTTKTDFLMGMYASATDRPKAPGGKSTGQGVSIDLKPTSRPDAKDHVDEAVQPEDNETQDGTFVQADPSSVPDTNQGEVACGICTFINSTSAIVCSMCGSPLG